MKKKLILLAITILAPFVVITNASAVTEQDQDILDSYYTSGYYNSNLPYCIQINSSNYDIYCFSDIDSVHMKASNNDRAIVRQGNYTFYTSRLFDGNWVKNGYYEENCSYTTCQLYNFKPRNTNFDLYDSNNTLYLAKNFDFASAPAQLYTITFNPPKDTTIVVKDSNNNEIAPKSQYVYELEPGSYTYSASNNLYSSLNDIAFEVTSDNTINVEMTSRIENSNMRSIFSQYYSYISVLVSDIFNIDNPIFLFLISFIIGFSMIYLIKKLIGGFL